MTSGDEQITRHGEILTFSIITFVRPRVGKLEINNSEKLVIDWFYLHK